MRWKRTNRGDWHRWYAWRPVETEDGTVIWLEMVERQYNHEFWWYRLPQREVDIAGSILDGLRK
jgi:hypothetical protein